MPVPSSSVAARSAGTRVPRRTTSALPSTATETRTCKGCNLEQDIEEFPWQNGGLRKDGTRYRARANYCKGCVREREARKRERNRARIRERNNEWRAKNPELSRARYKRYNDTEKGKAARKRYAHSYKGRVRAAANRRRQRRIAKLRLTANIPTPVIRPYVERLVIELGSVKALASAVDIDPKTLDRVVNGSSKSVQLDTADKLSLLGDFSLDELAYRAAEWALLTGDKWPVGYAPRVVAKPQAE